ncbi:glycosyltransferase [Rhodococcoides trifolii]|nr:glycosyltransferase [Rhodococcus trifolii]
MRIVQVANFYGPRSGGLRTAVDALGAGYVQRGHDVTVIVPGAAASEQLLPSGVLRITVPATKIPFTGGYRAADPRSVTDIASALRPDVVEVSDRLTLRGLGAWAGRRGIGSVMISHERLDRLLGQVLPPAVARAAADVANRRTAASYDAVVCTTQFARDEFDRVGAANVRRVPLGVDLDLFRPVPVAAGRTTRLLVHCGRLSVEKHVERSIDSLAHLRSTGHDVRLVIAGDGPRRAVLERRAGGLPVDFAGFISDREEVAALLADADVALAPGPHETFGLAALEALAAGTPVVVSGTSALAEIVTPECGAVTANSTTGFADGVRAALELPGGGRSAARRRAEGFAWSRSVDGMLRVLAG